MQRDIDQLREQSQLAQKGLAEQRAQLTEQMDRASERLKAVDEKILDLNRAARKDVAGIALDVEAVRREFQELRGQIELLNYQQSQLQTAIDGASPSSDSKLPAPTPPEPQAPTPAPQNMPKDKAGLLGLAKQRAKENKLEDARGILRQIIRKWPKDADGAGNAYFQLGELYFDEKKYRSAMQEYIQVIEKFADSNLVDDAYYRIGTCSMEMSNFEDAQIFFNEIVKNHKKSPLLSNAKKKLQELDKHLARERKRKSKGKGK